MARSSTVPVFLSVSAWEEGPDRCSQRLPRPSGCPSFPVAVPMSALGRVSSGANGRSRDVVARTCLRPSLLNDAIPTPDAIPASRTARAPGKIVTVEVKRLDKAELQTLA